METFGKRMEILGVLMILGIGIGFVLTHIFRKTRRINVVQGTLQKNH
jgi:hypothetical protein